MSVLLSAVLGLEELAPSWMCQVRTHRDSFNMYRVMTGNLFDIFDLLWNYSFCRGHVILVSPYVCSGYFLGCFFLFFSPVFLFRSPPA